MAFDNIKFNLKVFLIDKLYYEFKDKNCDEIIEIIKENHKNYIYANNADFSVVKPSLDSYVNGDFKFYTYCYNQPKNQNYWKLFLPEELVQGQNFELLEFSFVLFIIYKDNVYCVIGGSGINVIKKFIDPFFGIDLYQHFAKPNDDISLVVNTRGITGNLTERVNTFNYNQSINDSLDYSEIPKRFKIVVRDELKNGLFKKYNLGKDNAIMEVGSYFFLRKKINFDELQQLIMDIHAIRQDKQNYKQLTLFNKVIDNTLIYNLDEVLKEKIIDDVISHANPNQYLTNSKLIEFVNTNKLEKFYECNKFNIKFKKQRTVNELTINDRNKLYFECTKHIYNSIENINDRFSVKGKLFTLGIIGLIEEKESTFGTFYSHINAEITYLNNKYFKVDNQWFYLDSKFIEQIKEEAVNYYKLYKLDDGLLNKWDSNWDEDTYNKSHTASNYFIFDKVIKENIELCDILYIDLDDIYFVHVKNDFNTQMRNLSSQVVLSAKRLWNDINNLAGTNYFSNTIELYNSRNPHKMINAIDLLNKIKSNDIRVNFVMAYNNKSFKNNSSIEKIELSESNIARFALVQTVKEILNYRRFAIKLIDISEIK